jgi:hypothetical protein
MSSKRIPEGIKVALALPVYQIANLVAYANTRPSLAAKVATFVSFLPIIVLTTTFWAGVWALVLFLLWKLVN